MNALAVRNRAVIAERTGWPAGALAECERLDAEHPGWLVRWTRGCTASGCKRPAGWAATMPDADSMRGPSGGWTQPTAYGSDVAELGACIAGVEQLIAARDAQRARLWASIRSGLR